VPLASFQQFNVLSRRVVDRERQSGVAHDDGVVWEHAWEVREGTVREPDGRLVQWPANVRSPARKTGPHTSDLMNSEEYVGTC
jgi:hypothetical protein